jgi:arginase/N-omega-hydroxy-L-arginine amidinohydrolase
MALAASCGLWNYGLPAATKVDRVVLIGARALDRLESESLARHPIRRLPAQGNVASSLSKLPLGRKAYIHLDLDCLEPGFVPSQYEEPLGMMPATVQACIADIASRCDVVGLSISEFYQAHDADIDHEALRTVLEAV